MPAMMANASVQMPYHGEYANELCFTTEPYMPNDSTTSSTSAAAAAAIAASAFYQCPQLQEQLFNYVHEQRNRTPTSRYLRSRSRQNSLPLHPFSVLQKQKPEVMGDDAWCQSISDFEDGNYFNSPYLQHPVHLGPSTISDHPQNSVEISSVPSPEESYTYTGVMSENSMSDHALWTESLSESTPGTVNSTHFNNWQGSSGHEQSSFTASSTMDLFPSPSIRSATAHQAAFSSSIDLTASIGDLTRSRVIPHDIPTHEAMMQFDTSAQRHPDGSERWRYDDSHHNKTNSLQFHRLSPCSPAFSREVASSSVPSPSYCNEYDISRKSAFDLRPTPDPCVKFEPQTLTTAKPRKSLPNGPTKGNHSPTFLGAYPASASSQTLRLSSRSQSPGLGNDWQRSESVQPAQQRSVKGDTSSPAESEERAMKDDFLVRSRQQGKSYRDIKVQGGFVEAESTLRGRYRMLTKSKEERVRNPKWTATDVKLLRTAVLEMAHGKDPSHAKISWKEVAKYISDNGGSYHFGNATCRKKWDELSIIMEDRN